MNNKVKLKELRVKGFRGAKKEIWLDFESDDKSLVLFGNNGDGKSTFSDAIEWFYTDRIDYLQREGCGRDDYFNKYMPPEDDAEVEILTNNNILNSKKILKRKGGHYFPNTSNDFKDYISNSLRESFVLRHHTMREFIDKTKKEKLETIEEIIGFGIVREIRDTLLKTLNSLEDDSKLSRLYVQREERKKDLVNAMGKSDFGETDVLNHANQIAKQCDKNLSISTLSDLKSVSETLDRKVKASSKGRELAKLENFNKEISKLGKIKDILEEIKTILTSHNNLSNQQETIKASAIEKLYKAAIEAIENKWVKPGECPVCKEPKDLDLLLKSLKEEIEEIEKVLKERKKIIQDANLVGNKLSPLLNIINNLLQDEITKGFEIITIISIFLSQSQETLNQIKESPQAVMEPQIFYGLENLDENLKEIQAKIGQRKKELSESDEEKKFYENVHKLKKLYEDYSQYKKIDKLIGAYNNQIISLRKIYQDFERMEKESIQKVLKTLSADVNDFFKFLHPDDNFDEVELIPTEERGIEFKLKYHGEEIIPPMKILSEAHLNSLGICLFLASAKYFNAVNGFLVLDDVVTSFDTGHRRPLARLLNEKFADTQFLLFTHDELWFEMLKKDLSHGKWVFKELIKWTKDNGVDLKDSPSTLKERIEHLLKENDINGAANKCRTLIEEILKEKCENLGVKGLEFRRGIKNDQREASELIDALTSYLKENKSLRDKKAKKSFNHLRASQLITNIGSHHRTLTSTSLSRGDIETALRDIDEFEKLFICTNCDTEPNIRYSPRNSKLKQCECGKLRI